MMAEEHVIVTTATESEASAKKLAALIIEAGLAACVQCMPVHSIYRWKGAVESADEYLLSAKTRKSLCEDLTAFIRKNHSYELPEIITTPITDGLAAYLEWIRSETAQPDEQEPAKHCGNA